MRDWCTKVALQLLCFLKEKRLFHINFDPNKIYILNQSFNSMPAKPKKEEKRREEREEPPLYGDLPDKLTLRTAKAWRALAARLDKGSLLTEEQWRKKGLVWKYITLIPDKIKRYRITKDVKKLYGLTDGEYQDVKALINVYGKYAPDRYDSARPLSDIGEARLRRLRRNLADSVEGTEDEEYYEAA